MIIIHVGTVINNIRESIEYKKNLHKLITFPWNPYSRENFTMGLNSIAQVYFGLDLNFGHLVLCPFLSVFKGPMTCPQMWCDEPLQVHL